MLKLASEQKQFLYELAVLFAPSAEKPTDEYDLIRRCYEALSSWRAALPPVALIAKGMSPEAAAFQALLRDLPRPDVLFLARLPEAMNCRRAPLAKTVERLRDVLDELTTIVSKYQRDVETTIRKTFTLVRTSGQESLFNVAKKWIQSFPRAIAAQQDDLVAYRLFSMLDQQFENDERFVEALCLLLVGKVLIHWDAETAGRFQLKLDDLVSRTERRGFAAAKSDDTTAKEQGRIRLLLEARLLDLAETLQSVDKKNTCAQAVLKALQEN